MTPDPASAFDYTAAVSRNIGWVTVAEQQRLRGARVAIAGLGGVGGAHLLTLARLGIGSFHLSDFDTFDLPNFNRQAGAMMSTLGQPKADVLVSMARDINPELEVRVFEEGVDAKNVDAFLEGVELRPDFPHQLALVVAHPRDGVRAQATGPQLDAPLRADRLAAVGADAIEDAHSSIPIFSSSATRFLSA